MRHFLRPTVLLILVLVAVSIQAAPRRLILQIETAPLAWGTCQLEDHLVTAFSRNSDLQVHAPDLSLSGRPHFPEDRYNIDSLIDWGTEIGGRYLLVVSVTRETLERRKTFSVPLFFQRWETIAVIQGELRLLDLQKRRLLAAEPFEVEMSGARQFQGSTDNNRNDPSLHLAASQKTKLFRSLELKLAERLVKEVSKYTRGR